ncbi:ornithine cyclodeaminase [Rhodococcoides trifolii]|uniref:Ornithine cyclodeaminase n=1 Tax=Rhodococcoides trifolii TaxID=908250 RepID=A0A917CKZ8_9NOCA|nr:ornithine cyclodeaminase family protein [Rhodococcus trifolii]GGF92157.1 ornithine cyclodeaminase [Rhodococcus trifolii]
MVLVLGHDDIVGLLDRDEVRRAVEQALADLATGDAVNPAPVAMPVQGNGTVLPMAAAHGDLAIVKVLSDLPANRSAGLPVQRSTMVVTSTKTGEAVAVLDGRAITKVRTAATSAVATDHLARRDAVTLGLVGAGNLAVEHTFAIAAVRPLERVVVWSRSESTVEKYRAATQSLGLIVEVAPTIEYAVKAADVLCTLTPSRDPLVQGAWFEPGLHVNAVGAPPRPDHREIDGEGMARSRVVVDSRATSLAKSGDLLLAVAEGRIDSGAADLELGAVIAGSVVGRRSDRDITLFDSVGLGLQDLAAATLVLRAMSA